MRPAALSSLLLRVLGRPKFPVTSTCIPLLPLWFFSLLGLLFTINTGSLYQFPPWQRFKSYLGMNGESGSLTPFLTSDLLQSPTGSLDSPWVLPALKRSDPMKQGNSSTGEVAEQLRVLATVLSTTWQLTATCDLMPSLGLHWQLAYMVHKHTCKQNSHSQNCVYS